MAEKKVEKSREEKAVEKMKKEDAEKKEKKTEQKETKKEETKKAEKKPVKKKKLPEEIHTINLKAAYDKPRSRRAGAAINVIRDYVFKHKRKEAKISPELNVVIWERGIEKPPRKIKVKLVIGPEEVIVYPAE